MIAYVRPNEVLTLEGEVDAVTFRFYLRSAPKTIISQRMTHLQMESLRADPIYTVLTVCRRRMLEFRNPIHG